MVEGCLSDKKDNGGLVQYQLRQIHYQRLVQASVTRHSRACLPACLLIFRYVGWGWNVAQQFLTARPHALKNKKIKKENTAVFYFFYLFLYFFIYKILILEENIR